MFYPEGLVDFALEKSFIPKLPFFLLHRCVQKWLFAKYCPHFSFITLVCVHTLNVSILTKKKFIIKVLHTGYIKFSNLLLYIIKGILRQCGEPVIF